MVWKKTEYSFKNDMELYFLTLIGLTNKKAIWTLNIYNDLKSL